MILLGIDIDTIRRAWLRAVEIVILSLNRNVKSTKLTRECTGAGIGGFSQ
jgi:hypothetical protein